MDPAQPPAAGTWFLVMVAVVLFVGPLISLIR